MTHQSVHGIIRSASVAIADANFGLLEFEKAFPSQVCGTVLLLITVSDLICWRIKLTILCLLSLQITQKWIISTADLHRNGRPLWCQLYWNMSGSCPGWLAGPADDMDQRVGSGTAECTLRQARDAISGPEVPWDVESADWRHYARPDTQRENQVWNACHHPRTSEGHLRWLGTLGVASSIVEMQIHAD